MRIHDLLKQLTFTWNCWKLKIPKPPFGTNKTPKVTPDSGLNSQVLNYPPPRLCLVSLIKPSRSVSHSLFSGTLRFISYLIRRTKSRKEQSIKMALSSTSSIMPTKSTFIQSQSLLPSRPRQPSLPTNPHPRPIVAVHAADPAKNPVVSDKATKQQTVPASPSPSAAASSNGSSTNRNAVPAKWSLDTWKSKKALQLPEYPNKEDLDSVLRTLDSFPPIVFAGEARSLEERIAEASMGNAFLLQGGDCAESFKEFNANNIRDTFRILLQMGVVLMFGGQMPVIKVWVSCFFFGSKIQVICAEFLGIELGCGFLRWEEWRVSLRSQDPTHLRRRMV